MYIELGKDSYIHFVVIHCERVYFIPIRFVVQFMHGARFSLQVRVRLTSRGDAADDIDVREFYQPQEDERQARRHPDVNSL